MTMPDVVELFEYWRTDPPAHELVALAIEYKPPVTMETQTSQGAMGPEDFARWVESTDGKKLDPYG